MKFAPLALILVISIPTLSQNDMDWYLLGGLTLYEEDPDSVIGDGIGWRVGVGSQINKHYGFELVFDEAIAITPISALVDVVEYHWEDKAKANTYLSAMGTYTNEINDQFSLVGKFGFSRYTADVEFIAEEHIHQDDEEEEHPEHFRIDESGFDPVISGSVIFNFNEKSAVDFSLTHLLGDFGSTSFNISFRLNL